MPNAEKVAELRRDRDDYRAALVAIETDYRDQPVGQFAHDVLNRDKQTNGRKT